MNVPRFRSCCKHGERRWKKSRRGKGGDDRHHKQQRGRRRQQAPSKPSKGQRRKFSILQRDGYWCHYCDKVGDTLDHVVPASHGGTYALDNLVLACRECNVERSNTGYITFCESVDVRPDMRRFLAALKSVRNANLHRERFGA